MLCIVLPLLPLAACDQDRSGHGQIADDSRPNILLIVADDLGYADLGSFGSDIQTPSLDALAETGIRFTHFHTAPYCAPTRAMLLSGNNNHVAGMARQGRDGLLEYSVPGYENSLSDRIVPFPRLLQQAGYHTYTVGKWHLGLADENSPRAAGFTRAFNLLQGAGTHFDEIGYSDEDSKFRLDDELVSYPVGRYSTEVYTDQLIEFIEGNRNDGKPFFAFTAYTSPHWPLQVPDDYLDLYAGEFDDGYDALRVRNFENLKQAGILAEDSMLPPRNDAVTPWDELSADEQRRESRKMELYAAMVDNLDDHVGRLFDYLRQNDLYDNTLIVFMSDNGAAGEDFYNEGPYSEHIQAHFDNAYEKMGTAESFVSYDDPWAEAGSAPFMRRKGYTRQGGIAAPMIISGPGVAAAGLIDRTYLTVMDLAPTFLEIAGASYPADGSVRPMLGESMRAYLAGKAESVHSDDYVTALYHSGRAYLRQGDWKIANLEAPFSEGDFELFNLAEDPGETTNLADSFPEKYDEMIDLWREKRRELGILLPQDL
jgi:arylsulfatase